MRKVSLLLVFLLALLVAAGPAEALSLPAPLTLLAEEEGEELEEESGEESELEDEDESEELAEAEECVLKDASATVAANPGNSIVRLTVRYKAYKSSVVAVDSKLRGSKGGLYLGTSRARFRQTGVFHDGFALGKKEMARALAAREFAIGLRAVNAPASCALHLTASRDGGHKRLWS